MKLAATFFISLLYLGAIAGSYPFEKYPAPNYIHYTDKSRHLVVDSMSNCTLYFTDSRSHAKMKIRFTAERSKGGYNTFIYSNGKLIQKINDPGAYDWMHEFTDAYIGDLNNDSIPDIKLVMPNPGCGLAADRRIKTYFISKPDGSYSEYTFNDFSDHVERDFDGDGKFEIIGRDHDYYKEHSYWVFDLYSFEKGHLTNVSLQYGYPIMIQYLYKSNKVVTDKITPEKMKGFSRKLPEFLEERL